MSEPTRRKLRRGAPRFVDPVHPGRESPTDAFVDKYVKAMKEILQKPTEPAQPLWNPMLPVYSVNVYVSTPTESERTLLRLAQVSPTVADKAADFARFLALELRPGETLTVTAQRHEDVPMNTANPVVMTVPK